MATVEPIKKKSGSATRVATAIILLAVVFVVWYAIPRKQAPAGSLRFFTDDDGTSWFADSATKIPPFTHNGREAVLARIYQTTNGKQFVAYLEKYTEEKKSALETKTVGAAPAHAGVAVVKNNGTHSSGVLVKKPHQGTWIPEEDPASKEVVTFTAPDGSNDIVPANPE